LFAVLLKKRRKNGMIEVAHGGVEVGSSWSCRQGGRGVAGMGTRDGVAGRVGKMATKSKDKSNKTKINKLKIK
jgi:hypothetical protein